MGSEMCIRDRFANMPFDAIIGKDLLARLNVVISFGKKIVGVNIADGVQLTVDDEVTDTALDTDLDRNEIYLPTTASTFDQLQIDDTDEYSLLENTNKFSPVNAVRWMSDSLWI